MPFGIAFAVRASAVYTRSDSGEPAGGPPFPLLQRVEFHAVRRIHIQSRATGRLVLSGQAFRPAFANGERGTVPRRACELKGKCRESKEKDYFLAP
ncbi:MAG: hypothetical protein LAO76_24025 [Acidobacteriia bacterium]|nr:hypothetical protein [Terriglobia bacterium]